MSTRREMKETEPVEALRSVTESPVRTHTNLHEVDCSECGGHYFVDGATYERIEESLAADPAGIPYVCLECEEIEES